MCELYGFSAAKAYDIRASLKEFFSHAVENPHGWGISYENANGRQEIIKEPVSAMESHIVTGVVGSIPPQKLTLAHIRYATIGKIALENCHPHTAIDNSGRRWTLIHNGTIYSGKALAKYINIQKGSTDSERFFLYIMDEINQTILQNGGGDLRENMRFQLIDKIAVKLAPRNKLNFILSDSEILYVHKNMKGTLYYHKSPGAFMFSTKPLDNEKWEKFPTCQLQSFKDGEHILSGTKHPYTFVPKLDYIMNSDAMNI